MRDRQDIERLEDILDMIAKLASLDFSTELPVSGKQDMIDAISLGLNMLGEELNVQVVARARLDELNEKLEKFAYTTAHDLKSPLNSQSGLLNILEHTINFDKNPDTKEIVDRLKLMNEKMKNLVFEILEYSRLNSAHLKLEPVDLQQILDEVIELDGVQEHAQVQVEKKLPHVLLNTTLGIQIFRNLLDNAIKYNDKEQCRITINYRQLKNQIEISIADNGPGIDPKHCQQIFKLFEQGSYKLTKGSLGIGLATVKNIVNVVGGSIRVESEPGNGANFILTLKQIA